MRKSILVASMTLALAGIPLMHGCAGDKNAGGLQGVNGKQAADMNAARSQFDHVKDPPISADTHFAAGQFNETQGLAQVAIQQYQSALQLDSKHVASLFRLARLYSQQKQYPEAIETWNRYIAATDQSAVGYSNLGYCHELAGDPEAAEKAYQAGIERDAKHQACRVNYGLMLTRQGRLDDARAQFAEVLSTAQVHYNIASVLQQQGKTAAAKAEYEQAIKADPKFFDAQVRLADLEKN